MTAFLTLIGALVIVIAGLCTRWAWWAWPAAFGALLAVAAAVLVGVRRRRPLIPREFVLEPDLPIPPIERWEKVVRNIALPSLSPDYDFLVTALVRWVPVDVPHGAPEVSSAGLAVDAVLSRARVITVEQPPQRASLVQHQLSGELATMLPDATGRVLAMAENLVVTLSDADRERLEKLATVRKDEAVWEHERKWEQSKRAYLGKDVLTSTGSAVVWWLAKNDDKVDKAVADIGLLAQLTAVANDEPVPERLHGFLGGVGEGEALRNAPVDGGEGDEGQGADEEAAETFADRFTRLMHDSGLDEDDPRWLLFARRVADDARATGVPGAETLVGLADEMERDLQGPPTDDEETPGNHEGPGTGPSQNHPTGEAGPGDDRW
ncbi:MULTISPECIES: hypothetical protein [unclassified Streptomyces]|uniref:hypothetical protein n=1 Tax=unclassified Streptomyces TaxID=2593676 RepID=UPI002E35427D|nr:hypothetical protein [Streptomyces sp. NBC_01268]